MRDVEVCWFLYGVRFAHGFCGYTRFHSRGSVAHVDFDWEKGMSPFVLGWMHTHPDGMDTTPSGEDNKTMRSWVKALSRPFICAIKIDDARPAFQIGWYEYRRGQGGDVIREELDVTSSMGILKGCYRRPRFTYSV